MNNEKLLINDLKSNNSEIMSNKQIEEMAKVIKSSLDNLGSGNHHFTGEEISTMFAEALYHAGYRKQKRGEWKQAYNNYPRYVCTACNHLFNNKEYKYCPNCGAKMKGE